MLNALAEERMQGIESFHRFYTACRIKGAEEDVLNARLLLVDCTRRVIALSLAIIGVTAPEKM